MFGGAFRRVVSMSWTDMAEDVCGFWEFLPPADTSRLEDFLCLPDHRGARWRPWRGRGEVTVLCKVPHSPARRGCLKFVPAAEIYRVLKIMTVNMQMMAFDAISPEILIERLEKAPLPARAALSGPEYHFFTFCKTTSGNTGFIHVMHGCGM